MFLTEPFLAFMKLEERKQGRSYNTHKTKAIVGAGFSDKKKIKRVCAQVIDDYSSASFVLFFKQHIDKDAQVITDRWAGYAPLKKIIQVKSEGFSEDPSSYPLTKDQEENPTSSCLKTAYAGFF